MAKKQYRQRRIEPDTVPDAVLQREDEPVPDLPVRFRIPVPPQIADPPPVILDPAPPGPILELPDRTIPELDRDLMDAGCEKLLEYLPVETAEQIREYQVQHGVPLWQIVAGYVQRCRETVGLFTPQILPDWDEMESPNADKSCPICFGIFTPDYWGQKYCSTACGVRAETMGVHRT